MHGRDAGVIIDVRGAQEYAYGHVPGALHIPEGQTERMAEAIGARDRSAVLYCQSGRRSSGAVDALRELGYTFVVNGGTAADLADRLGVSLEASEDSGCPDGKCAIPNPVAGTFVSEADQEKARALTTAYKKGYAEGAASTTPGVNPVLAAVGGLLVGALIVRMAWGAR
jgi:rhodanese-related sulfurtransferase